MQTLPRIAVYAMAKNEIAHVEQFAAAVRGADLVVVTDTGSTDGTPAALERHGITVRHARIMPWRFDMGTNCAMCNVPDDIDLCVKLDLDEVIHSKDGSPWRAELDQLWLQGARQITYWYTWSWITRGQTPGVRFRATHVHARNGFTWRFPGHAGLYASEPAKIAQASNFEIHHYADGTKARPNYMALLKLGVRECRCPRTLFYYGRECYFDNQMSQAVTALTDYLALPESTWKDERVVAMHYLAQAYTALNQPTKAMTIILQAHAEVPNCRELWFSTMELFDASKDMQGGFWAATRCMGISQRIGGWTANTNAWAPPAYLLAATFAMRTRNNSHAVHWLQTGLSLFPQSTELQQALHQAQGM